MGEKANQTENADIRVLRNHQAELEQDRSEADEVIKVGDDAQQYEGRIAHNRLTRQIQAVEDQIADMIGFIAERPATQDGTISIGQVVTIRLDGGATKTFMLVNEGGGQELPGKTTLSSGTPVGSALIGRRVGETVSVDVEGDQFTVEVVSCGVQAST